MTSPLVTTIFHIEGMSCRHCQATLQHALESLDGVQGVKVDLVTAMAEITYNAPTSVEGLVSVIEAVGFAVNGSE